MIEVTGLTRYYGDHRAIENLSFRIETHQIVGVLGLNGAGKSTTLRILAGLLMPSEGTVRIDGQDILDAPLEWRRQIGFLPEDPPLYDEMVVRDFLRYTGRLRGMSSQAVEAAIEDVAGRTAIHEVLDRVIDTLSHGFRKRVGIAQSIIHSPSLVILDEPISGLDPVQIVEMREVVGRFREGCTVLVSSHILSEISQTCDHILVLHEGRLVAQGTEEELAARILQGRKLALVLRGTTPMVAKLLEGAPEVEHVDGIEEREGLIQARLTLSGDTREALVSRLAGAGVGIRKVDDGEAELEQIFIGLTRENAA
jgi:ABC-2 type transport system ATP-binding protein